MRAQANNPTLGQVLGDLHFWWRSSSCPGAYFRSSGNREGLLHSLPTGLVVSTGLSRSETGPYKRAGSSGAGSVQVRARGGRSAPPGVHARAQAAAVPAAADSATSFGTSRNKQATIRSRSR